MVQRGYLAYLGDDICVTVRALIEVAAGFWYLRSVLFVEPGIIEV